MRKFLLVSGIISSVASILLLILSIAPHREANHMYSLVEQAEQELASGVDEFGDQLNLDRRLHVATTLEGRWRAYKSSSAGRNLLLAGFGVFAIASVGSFVGRKKMSK